MCRARKVDVTEKRFGWVLALAVLLAFSAGRARAGEVELVSRIEPSFLPDTGGGSSEIRSTTGLRLSSDGRFILFTSTSANLVSGQIDRGGNDVFLYDRVSGSTILVSRSGASATTTGNASSAFDDSPSISADGRYVTFSSLATDLVPGLVDINNQSDVFLYDRVTGTTTLVSRAQGSALTTGNHFASDPVLSADGRYVAFRSRATDLIDGFLGDGFHINVFLYDRVTGQMALVSRTSSSPATSGGSSSEEVAVSSDGRYVAFLSTANNLVPGQTGLMGNQNLYLYDRVTGATTLVSHTSGSPLASTNAISSLPSLSGDGRYLVFQSDASNLVPGQSDNAFGSSPDVFLYDRETGVTTLVSHVPGSPATAAEWSGGPCISEDGLFIAFSSSATNLVSGTPDLNEASDAFLFDRVAGTITLLTPSANGQIVENRHSGAVGINADGSRVVISSLAPNLVPGQVDPSYSNDVFLYDRPSGTMTLVSRASHSPVTAGNEGSGSAVVSADGGYVAFESGATDLAAGVRDSNNYLDIFLFSRATGTNTLVSRRAADLPSVTPSGYSWAPAVSDDGRFVAFVSDAPDLVPGQVDTNEDYDVFLHDRLTRTTVLVSRSPGSPVTAVGAGIFPLEPLRPLMSADGRFVVFQSDSVFDRLTGTVTQPVDGLIQGFSADGRYLVFNQSAHVYLYDQVTGTTTLVRESTSTGFDPSEKPVISADGRYVAYATDEGYVVPGQVDTNGGDDIFLFDRDTGANVLVSHNSSSQTTSGDFASPTYGSPRISGDGRYVAFLSRATDLVPGQSTNNQTNVFLYDRVTGDITLVSRSHVSPTRGGNGPSDSPALSADGRYVSFRSDATNLVAGQTGPFGSQVYLYDRTSGTTRLVSHQSASHLSGCNGGSGEALEISSDGQLVVFTSDATDLVAGVSAGFNNVYLYDQLSGETSLVSRSLGSATIAANGSYQPQINADGNVVVFMSERDNLVQGDFNHANDVFAYISLLPGRDFFTLTPCRVLDTRQPQDGPALTSSQPETLSLHGVCGIPATARAVAVNITVTQPTGAGHLIFYPGDVAPPAASTINFSPGQTRANNAILPLSLNGLGTLKVSPAITGGGTVHVILDVVGYFE